MQSVAQTIDSKVRSLIYGHGRGWVFTPKHFLKLGKRDAIDSALRRLRVEGVIRRLARGLYDYPVQDPQIGVLTPSADAIARALVVRDAIRLQPSGAYAANRLGLSEQVPSRIVFLTDGPSRTVKIGKRIVILQRTTPRNMAMAGRKSGLIVQALRHLGQAQVDDHVLGIVRRQILDTDKPVLRDDLCHSPAWIADLLHDLLAVAPVAAALSIHSMPCKSSPSP